MKIISKKIQVHYKDFIDGKTIYTKANPITIIIRQKYKKKYEVKQDLQKMFAKTV